jgi:hypothetical protein
MNIPGLEKEIEILKENLDKGWSIYYSLAKAGIKQHVHTKLLANPEYNSFIAKYRRYQKSAKIYY